MSNKDYFDSAYVGEDQTSQPIQKGSEVKRLLKESTDELEMLRYGTSKPFRIVIKGKIIDGKG